VTALVSGLVMALVSGLVLALEMEVAMENQKVGASAKGSGEATELKTHKNM
jgi:hypothetical protein